MAAAVTQGRAPCLESPAGGELGGGESDDEGGSVEGDVGDDDGRVGGRAGGLWVAELECLRWDRLVFVGTSMLSPLGPLRG